MRLTASLLDQLDVIGRIALILDQSNEVITVLILAVQIQTGFDEERQKTLDRKSVV